jgi:spore germination protein YaaH
MNRNLAARIYSIVVCFLAFGIINNTPGQVPVSVHQQQALQFRKNVPINILDEHSKFKKSKSANSSAIIFGYLPDWGYPYTKSYLRYDILTHIAVFDFQVDSTGTITNPLNWPWTDVITLSHQNDVKVILCATNFSAASIHALMNSTTYKAAFYSNVMNIILANNLDGVNIDFEGLYQEDQGTVLNTFMTDLSTYIKAQKSGAEISFAGSGITSNYYKLLGLANACDYIFIMAYSYYGSWSTTTGGPSPLTGGSFNVTNTMNVQYGSVTTNAPQKLILGLPYYGVQWNTTTNTEYASVRKFLSYTLYADDIVNSQAAGTKWCTGEQVPWYVTLADTDYKQTWFDNDSSLGLKYTYAKSKNYGGVGIWALGYDRDRTELWDKLYEIYYNTSAVKDLQNTGNNKNFALYQNYPNPFNPSTKIEFKLLNQSYIKLVIYDVLGREMMVLANGLWGKGNHSLVLNGDKLNSGYYVASLTCNGQREVIKMLLVK